MTYPQMPWTPADDELLRKLILENASPHEIAAGLKRSVSSIRARAHKLGIPLGYLRGNGLGRTGFHRSALGSTHNP
jgi:hypothetical protein